MKKREKVIMAWSGGKDSALAFHRMAGDGSKEIDLLLSTVTEPYDRISMHGVRRVLLERQALSMGIGLGTVHISESSSCDEYESKMRAFLEESIGRGVSSVAFGDIFLEDLRKYREDKLAELGLKGIFPLWKGDTAALAGEFISRGFKAVITCVDSDALDGSFAGREFDRQFLKDLPPSVDPCGENGEFHSFVYEGPIFKEPVLWEKGEVVVRAGRFYYCDLVPR
ncbi:MAG: diphthine--ammonia ligase [Candidatus Omnitrophota bacterium]